MVRWSRVVLVTVFAASLLVVAVPGVHAEPIPETLAERGAIRAEAVSADFPIDYVGVFWDIPADSDGHAHAHAVDDDHGHDAAPHGEIRLRHDGRWGAWMPLVEDGAQAEGRWTGSLVPAADAEAYQVRGVPADAIRPQAVAINTTDGPAREVRTRPRSAEALPLCSSRHDWGADESLRTSNRDFAPVQVMTVHHTATANDDADPKATVRAIYRYHAVDNGWDDIGYQYLVGEDGRLYEGRWSGADSEPCESDPQAGPGLSGVIGDGRDFAHDGAERLVTGAHTGGYNTGNIGVALLGDFQDHPRFGAEPKAAAVAALEDTLAELAVRHGFTRAQLVGDEKVAYANSVNSATVDAISGHRDFTATECPGQRLYDRIQTIRGNVADRAEANAAPQVTVLEPADGTTVATGTPVRFSAGVADDDAAPADVVWTSGTTVLHEGGSFETVLADGSHTITATVTDTGGHTDTASLAVSVGEGSGAEPEPTDPSNGTIHVGGLTDVSTNAPGPNWDATVRVLAHDAAHTGAGGVAVAGTWGDGTSATCTTGGDGTCTVALRLNEKKTTSTTFTVLGLSRAGDTYDPAANHDPSGGEPTTTVTRP